MSASDIVNALRPSDWITIVYLTITGVLACIYRRFHKNLRWWWIYVVSHASAICGLLWLAFPPEDSLPLPLQVLRDWYPISTIPIFYLEIPPLTQMVMQRYFDDKVIEWEARLFNGQPSIYLSEHFPSKMAFGTFTSMLFQLLSHCFWARLECFTFQGRHEAFHEVVFAEILTFNLCLIWYIFMPVMGPRYKFERISGPSRGWIRVFKLVHMILSMRII